MNHTELHEQRVRQRVHNQMNATTKKRSWNIPIVTTAMVALSLFLIITMNPFELLSTEKGRSVPYDPLEDILTISTLHQNKLLSSINYEELGKLPLLESLSDLQYVTQESFSIKGETNYHAVIERQSNLFDEVVYEPGDVVRTMTNTSSHLPIYSDTYYEIVAVPGDRVILRDGILMVNGKRIDSQLVKRYEGNKILGDYEQRLNAREYFLLNHFPAEQSEQAATITPVHKILGKVVALAKENDTETIFFEGENIVNNVPVVGYRPEQYFDLYLYDKIFGDGQIATYLTKDNATFTYSERTAELFLEAGYRTVTYLSDRKVEIRYQYRQEGIGEYTFYMYKVPNSTIWQWGI